MMVFSMAIEYIRLNRICVCALLFFAACTKAPIYQPDPSDTPSTLPLVTVIYDPGALGDMTYNDLIYEGVERAAIEHGLRTRQYSPNNLEEGIFFLSSLFDQMSDPADTTRQLLIVAGSSYDKLVRSNNKRLEANPRADLLYFETKEPLEGKGSSIHIRFYGAMYMAGAVTPLFSNEVLMVAANPYDVHDAEEGFKAGFNSEFSHNLSDPISQDRTLFVEYLADQPGQGYSIDDVTALHLMYEQPWSSYYTKTIIPLCGGASAVFRRLAENDGFFSFMGIDSVILSVSSSYAAIKHSDQVVEECIGQWISEGGLPKHQSFGLDEYYTEMNFCPAESEDMSVFFDILPGDTFPSLYREAVEKEAQYENS